MPLMRHCEDPLKEPWQLALFLVWERNTKLARVAEAVGSVGNLRPFISTPKIN